MKVGPGNQNSSILDNVCGHNTLGKGKKVNRDTRFLHILPFFTQIMPHFVKNRKYKVVPLWKTDLETNFCQLSTLYMVTASLECLISKMCLSLVLQAWCFSFHFCHNLSKRLQIFISGTWDACWTTKTLAWVKNGKMCKNLVSPLTFFPFPRVLWPHTLSKIDEIWFPGPTLIEEQLCFYGF